MPGPTDVPSAGLPRLSEDERRHHLAVVEAHGGTQLTYPCRVHGDEHLCAERVASWNALAGDGLLPTVDAELAAAHQERG